MGSRTGLRVGRAALAAVILGAAPAAWGTGAVGAGKLTRVGLPFSPEPATALLLASGLAGIAAQRRARARTGRSGPDPLAQALRRLERQVLRGPTSR